MCASIQLLLGSCMYSCPKKLTQSKNGAVLFGFKMKLESLSAKRSVLGEILLYVTAVYYRVELL